MNQLQQSLVGQELEELSFFRDKWIEDPSTEMKAVPLAGQFIDFLTRLQKLEGIEVEEVGAGVGIKATHVPTGLFVCEYASGRNNEEVAIEKLLLLLDEQATEEEKKTDFRGNQILYK